MIKTFLLWINPIHNVGEPKYLPSIISPLTSPNVEISLANFTLSCTSDNIFNLNQERSSKKTHFSSVILTKLKLFQLLL